MTSYLYVLNGQQIVTPTFRDDAGVLHYLDSLGNKTPEELTAIGVERLEAPSSVMTLDRLQAMIDGQRDARIDSGFSHNGQTYQSRQSDRENIMGAAVAAQLYLGAGGDPSAQDWSQPGQPFVWITADNSLVPMNPMDVLALYQRGVGFKAAQTFYARALKDAAAQADADGESLADFDWQTGWPD